jgi:aminoglycoside phosphotransferase family enzyme/predicted kinase
MARIALEVDTPAGAIKSPSATGRLPASAALVDLLLSPNTYRDRTSVVSLVETHISWVFLTDRFVYKLKKPVRFDFLDFSTPQARREACEAECRLNEPLAPGVYLGVLPMTESKGRLALGGSGQPVDWVVKMRRLPADRMLDQLIRSGQLTDSDAERLATWLAKRYQRMSSVCVSAAEYRQAMEKHVLGNLAELIDPKHRLPVDLVKRCQAAQLRFLELEQPRLDERVCDGRIIDGHGDLRPEHICLENEPIVFDCIEFNDDLRHLDVADELGFLAMECDYLGADRLGQKIVSAYQRLNNDHFPDALGNFYKCYRASVRAKVAAIAAEQAIAPHVEEPRRRAIAYLELADCYASQLGTPTLIVVCGLMGSGKTTLATALAKQLGSEYLGTDAIRRELLGASPSPAAFNEGHYTAELRARVYSEMLHLAQLRLRERLSVVLDGAFLKADERHAAIALAHACGALPLIVHCSCPAAVVMERIEHRAAGATSSEARTELYASQQAVEEPLDNSHDALDIDTTDALQLQQQTVVRSLRSRLHLWR